ncbi:MAG TPA: phosphoribosylanthranilate isomerase [Rhizomicrobium sp.]|nr:phosphoribosylanthranilate isomerase [Rhizomicrobium sp.]
MATKVKICGLTRPEDALAAARAGADFAGLVFHPGSPRYVSPDKAGAIAAALRGRVPVVALFVDAGDQTIAGGAAAARPDFLQLHGSESPKRVAEIRARFGIPVVKAIGISEAQDFDQVPEYEAVADMLLFEGKTASGLQGGMGCAFDWQLLRERRIRKPWLLAGGLNVQNVARAIRTAGAPGVDVSSGVETAPGIKDAQKIADFVAAARAAEFAVEQPA